MLSIGIILQVYLIKGFRGEQLFSKKSQQTFLFYTKCISMSFLPFSYLFYKVAPKFSFLCLFFFIFYFVTSLSRRLNFITPKTPTLIHILLHFYSHVSQPLSKLTCSNIKAPLSHYELIFEMMN